MDAFKSQRNGQKLAYKGHSFNYEKRSGDRTKDFWRCDKRTALGCYARVHTLVESGIVVQEVRRHNHGSDAAEVAVSKIVSNIRERAATTLESTSTILNGAYQGQSQAVQGKLPNHNALKKMVQRQRTVASSVPPNPISLSELVLPEDICWYSTGPDQAENFLLFDSGAQSQNRIIIFGRASNGNWADRMKKLFIDGSFRIAPRLFYQIFVVMAERSGGFVFPVAYGLLPNKTQQTYTQFFEALKHVWPTLQPDAISCDFELAEINAVRAAFPNAAVEGCFFHFVKNLKKKLAAEHLLPKYNQDAEFALSARRVAAMAFVPPERLEEAFDDLLLQSPQELEPVLNWFEDYYLGRPSLTGGRRMPLFPHSLWSVYVRTISGVGRTNNHVEAAHRRMQVEFGDDHPEIWKFIQALKKIQSGRDKVYEQFVRGEEPPDKRTKYVRADERILRLVTELQEGEGRTIGEYLRGLAHNFLME